MQLNLHQIKEIALGAARVEQCDNGFNFYRFTKQQEKLYKPREHFYFKTLSTSGIKLCFKTNSESLLIKGTLLHGSARRYYAFELFINGEKVDALENFSDKDLPQLYPLGEFPLDDFCKEFSLGTGEKEVCLYFPWSVGAVIKEICVDDGCFIKPVKPRYKLLCFGDSITHGYDALYPSNKYATRLADSLRAEEYNKGIGGEMFFPPLAAAKEDFEPDFITVAYGTNDWSFRTKEIFTERCKQFYDNLSHTYPNTPIFAISPIWRKDNDQLKQLGEFRIVHETIKEVSSRHKNITYISGLELMPEDEALLADRRVHPNDQGFEIYFNNLASKIKATIKNSK